MPRTWQYSYIEPCVTHLLGHVQGAESPTHLNALPRRIGFAVGEVSLEKALIYGCRGMRARS